jgi:NIMA-interacting peptidyl-prolyl cis-trans isomerase 4
LWPFICSARHILCEKQGKINEAYKKLQDGWLSNGDKVPPAEFAKVNNQGYYFFFKLSL